MEAYTHFAIDLITAITYFTLSITMLTLCISFSYILFISVISRSEKKNNRKLSSIEQIPSRSSESISHEEPQRVIEDKTIDKPVYRVGWASAHIENCYYCKKHVYCEELLRLIQEKECQSLLSMQG